MAEYNKLYEVLGSISQLAGLGTIVYGLVNQDIETIAGGAAMSYAGNMMSKDCWEIQRNVIERQRNEILRNKPSIDDKLEG
jgi:hypothetical protein